MRNAVVGLSSLLFLSSLAFADIPNRPHSAVQEAIAPHGGGGATGFCSIVYYNLCSGWLWTFSGWGPGDEAGVAFDLPADCNKLTGETCANTHFWWYWRYTAPARGYTVSYALYNLDASGCKVGASVGSIAGYDPVERWNFSSGLGTVSSDFAGLIATWDVGALPRIATDNANANYLAPVACAGYTVGAIHALYWGNAVSQYCPPQYFAPGGYVTQCLMDAGWECGPCCPPDATEPSSWSSVKRLFR